MPDYARLPLFGLHTVLFPQMSLPLRIFEPRYRQLIERCEREQEPFGIVLLARGSEVEALSREPAAPHSVGTLARIRRCEWQEGRLEAQIEVAGETRFTIEETFTDQPYLTGRVTPFWEQASDPLAVKPLVDRASDLFRSHIGQHLSRVRLPEDPVLLSFVIAAMLPVAPVEKQRLLATPYTQVRLSRELELLQMEESHRRPDPPMRGARTTDDAPAIVMPVDAAALRNFLSKN